MDVIEGAMSQHTAPKMSGKPKGNQWRIQTLSLRGPGSVSLALPTFFPSVISSFFTQIGGGGGRGGAAGPQGPSSRSAT